MSSSKFVIRTLGDAPAIQFAASELQRYISQMTGNQVQPVIQPAKEYAPDSDSLWLVSAGCASQALAERLPKVPDSRWDDAYVAEVTNGKGTILGNNPRSVLIGAYALLTAAGCRWVRPGKDGEVIPSAGIEQLTLNKTSAASYRHRGICIEGAISYENVADIIDFAPKVGYNAYFTQFRESYTFFERWYHHTDNPNRKPEEFSVEMARDFLRRAQAEMQKRGMIYHAVGHGWTCEPFGIAGLGWESKDYDISDEVRSHLAEVNGVRDIWHGVPLNTNLCYSNPVVRQKVVENIAEYCAANPQVDVVHFWLADDSNNQCECANCRHTRPSDFYVMMLNELDALITERGIPTRVVFLIYVDLLWPPKQQELVNQERFILMFAPITRSYTTPFSVEGELPELPPFELNRLKFPKNVTENVAFLKAWQEHFSGDSFDFDYHLMWDHFNDPSYVSTAAILGEDARRLEAIGLNGYMSCQLQRIFFPTGLPMAVLGSILWDKTADYDTIANDYYAASFGQGWQDTKQYLETLSQLFCPPYIRGERPVIDAEVAEGLARIRSVVEGFKPTIATQQQIAVGSQKKSWDYLATHADCCIMLAQALLQRAQGNQEGAKATWQELVKFVWDQEPNLQPVLDTYLFVRTMGRLFA
ncbi:MAG: DUF4838 domain-containing protein [Chloroflexi bacterium]|nr:DUF4838 domain-containing protein [Chloroflexota bacterium]